MTDDLVKRLRGYGSNRYWPHGPACDCTQAADRIEELEAKQKKAAQDFAEIILHCANFGRWVPSIDEGIIERCEETAANAIEYLAGSKDEKAVKDGIKALEWRVWHGGNHSKCGRFVVLPEGNMFRLTYARPDVKSDMLVKQSCLYTSRKIAMEQANAFHQNEILSWLENGIAELTGGNDE